MSEQNRKVSKNKIFSISKDRNHRIIYFLGIKLAIKDKNLELRNKIKDMKRIISALEQQCFRMGNECRFFNQVVIKEQVEGFIKQRDLISKDEYKRLTDGLYKGLNERNKAELDAILEKKDKLYYSGGVVPLNFIFSDEEMQKRYEVLKFNKSIAKHDNYFEWNGFKLPIGFFEPSVFYYEGGCPEISNKAYVKDKAIIDVGTFVGDSILIFRKYFKDNFIYSFEAAKVNFDLALKTLELNDIKNVKIENLALGDKEKILKIHYGQGASVGAHITDDNDASTATIQATTLDNYVAKNNIEVGLIKVDIEGYEQNFLKGAVNTIKTQKPILLLSIYHNFNDFFGIKPFIEEISDNAYEFRFIQPILPDNATYEIMLIAEPKE